MANTYVDALKKDAKVSIELSIKDIHVLQVVLLKNSLGQTVDKSLIDSLFILCDRIDENAKNQNQTVLKAVEL